MKIQRESALLAKADAPTKKMLAIWHRLCRDVLKGDLEVGVADRHEYGPTKHYKGELNTALPMPIDGKTMLVLLFDNAESPEDLMITHELGHWVLELLGFKGVQNRKSPHSAAEIMLNSMSQHSALYVLQRSAGHEPQSEIDKRARHNLSKLKTAAFTLSPSKATPSKNGQIAEIGVDKILLLADDVLHCSQDLAAEIFATLKHDRPKAEECVRDIRGLRDSLDPAQLDTHAPFVRAVMRRLDFGSGWITVDEMPGLKC